MDKIKVIDFHAHIVPYIDHGSTSLDVSLDQVEFAVNAGINEIVATPHFYPHNHDINEFLELRNEYFKVLKNAVSEKGIPIDLKLGAEVLLCPDMERLPRLNELCIEGTNSLLIEIPFSEFRIDYISTLENLISEGYNVILAHVDRYSINLIEQLSVLGVSFQVNVDALASFIKRRSLYDWIERGLVVALGSDIHMLNKSAYKDFVKASKKLKNNFSEIMIKTNALLI